MFIEASYGRKFPVIYYNDMIKINQQFSDIVLYNTIRAHAIDTAGNNEKDVFFYCKLIKFIESELKNPVFCDAWNRQKNYSKKQN
jgi:hypothetical protein